MKDLRVAVCSGGPIHNDPRVRKSAQWWRNQGAEVTYIHGWAYNPDQTNPAWEVGELDDCRVVEVSDHYGYAVRSLVTENRCDVVVAHEIDMLAKVVGVPSLEHSRRLSEGESEQDVDLPMQRIPGFLIYDSHELEQDRRWPTLTGQEIENRRWLDRKAASYCNMVVTPSPAICDRIDEYTDADTNVIPNSPMIPASVPHSDGPLREHLGVKEDETLVVFSGNITPSRNLHHLAEAVMALNERGEKYKILCVGEPYTVEVIETLKRAGAMFTGLQAYPYDPLNSSMLGIIAAGDVGFNGLDICCESYRLSLANKVFEYAWAGLPMVYSFGAVETEDLSKGYGLGLGYNNTVRDLMDVLERFKRTDPQRVRLLQSDRMKFMGHWCYDNMSKVAFGQFLGR